MWRHLCHRASLVPGPACAWCPSCLTLLLPGIACAPCPLCPTSLTPGSSCAWQCSCPASHVPSAQRHSCPDITHAHCMMSLVPGIDCAPCPSSPTSLVPGISCAQCTRHRSYPAPLMPQVVCVCPEWDTMGSPVQNHPVATQHLYCRHSSVTPGAMTQVGGVPQNGEAAYRGFTPAGS